MTRHAEILVYVMGVVEEELIPAGLFAVGPRGRTLTGGPGQEHYWKLRAENFFVSAEEQSSCLDYLISSGFYVLTDAGRAERDKLIKSPASN